MKTITLTGNVDYTMFTVLASNLTGTDPVRILISSWGGDLGASLAMYNLITSQALDVTTHNIGEVSSAANIIFLAGKERYACEHSYFRHHGTFWNTSGNLHKVQYEDILGTLGEVENQFGSIFASRTSLKAEEALKFFRTPTVMNPSEAQKAGIIHGIKNIN